MASALDFQIQMILGEFISIIRDFSDIKAKNETSSKSQFLKKRVCPRSRMISTMSLNENPMNNPRVPPTDPTNPVISYIKYS